MAFHETIDPAKAIRWERSLAVKQLLVRLAAVAVIVLAGLVLLRAASEWRTLHPAITATVTEPTGADGLSTIRYVDLRGGEHVKRLAVGQQDRGQQVTVLVDDADPDNPLPEGTPLILARSYVGYVVLLGAVAVAAGIPALLVRIEKTGKLARVLTTPPIEARFSWNIDQTRGAKEYKGRISPRADVWKERIVLLGEGRPPIGNDTHEVIVIGEPRGLDPIIVVGDAWSFVALR